MALNNLESVASNLSVLYIEDNCIFSVEPAKFLKKIFKKAFVTHDKEEALDAYKTEKFDLVITGLQTQIMDGLKLISDIRRINELQSIVVVGEYTNDSKITKELLNSAIDGFIEKHLFMDEAKETLAKVCAKIQNKLALAYYHDGLKKLQKAILSPDNYSRCCSECRLKDILSKKEKLELELERCNQIKPLEAEEVKKPKETEEHKEAKKPENNNKVEILKALVADNKRKKMEESPYRDYFKFLQQDDREELRDQLVDIDLSLLGAFSRNNANEEYIQKLGHALTRYAGVLTLYQFFNDMGLAIAELGAKIVEYPERIAEQQVDFKLYLSGFCSVLQSFMLEVWDKNYENPKFFNDSIINDSKLIIEMITPSTHTEDDDNLIFF